MFTKPTAVILGAGASSECGMPLGGSLLNSVCDAVRFRFEFGSRQTSGDDGIWQLLIRRFGVDVANEYSKAGNALAEASKHFQSVDEALHFMGDNEAAVRLGKLAIAKVIQAAESKTAFAANRETSRVNIDTLANSWYGAFLSIALAGFKKSEIGSLMKNVRFINFNYDRTLECYLYHALTGRLDVSADLACSIVSGMTIIRPYGSLGGLPLGGRNTPIDTFTGDLLDMADRIRTFTEERQSEVAEKVREALDWAKVVIILGFGFHAQNVSLFDRAGNQRGTAVFATTKALHQENVRNLERLVGHVFNSNFVRLLDMSAAELLTKLRPSIVAAACS